MYTIMLKDKPLIDFVLIQDELTGEFVAKDCQVYERPWFLPNTQTWLRERHAPKHRTHMTHLMQELGLRNLKVIIDFSRGLALTDPLWINVDDKFQWGQINLFHNEFDEVISRIAFDGGTYVHPVSATSPELTTDGAFAKCWIREKDGIVSLMKQGSEGASNAGLEPYSEQYCSEVLDALNYPHVHYDVVKFRGKLVSKCALLTNPEVIMLPMSRCLESYALAAIAQYCKESNALDRLYQLLVFDYLVYNDDRHLNNVAMLFDAVDYKPIGMAPLFDHGAGLLPYAVEDNLSSPEKLQAYLNGKGPRFYDDFFTAAKNIKRHTALQKVRTLLNFKFCRDYQYQLPEWRLQALEKFVQKQARNLLADNHPVNIRGVEPTSEW